MARRTHSNEINVGSDSFMDVIANIVGILIILIVIAGLRVSRAPVVLSSKDAHDLAKPDASNKENQDTAQSVASVTSNPAEETPGGVDNSQSADIQQPANEAPLQVPMTPEPTEPPISEPQIALPQVAEGTTPSTQQEPEEPTVEVDAQPLEERFVETATPPVEIAQAIKKGSDQLASLNAAIAATNASIHELELRGLQAKTRLNEKRDLLKSLQSQAETQRSGMGENQVQLKSRQAHLMLLQSQIQDLEKRPSTVKSIQHRVTPISRVVSEEVHFRLSNNKVSFVPIDDLLQAAMRQAKKLTEHFSESRTRIGTVGPLGGFVLQYKLQVVAASAADQARFGPGSMRIALTSFQVDPDQDFVEETIEEALRKGSNFDLAIQSARPDTAFTIWVYPDSFVGYRRLRDRLHEAGQTVAGRPIPKGVPIAGSPDGTASTGQ